MMFLGGIHKAIRRLVVMGCLVLSSHSLLAQNTDSLISYYSEKAEKYLVRHPSIKSHYRINAEGITLYATPDDRLTNNAEFQLTWEEVKAFKHMIDKEQAAECMSVYSKKKSEPLSNYYKPGRVKASVDNLRGEKKPGPLQGFRIAIDPGHFGRNWHEGFNEGRAMFMKAGNHPDTEKEIRFHESDLAMKTAIMLKRKLERAGAQTFLSRKSKNESAFGKPFKKWLKEDFKRSVDSMYDAGDLTRDQKAYWLNKADTSRIMQGIFSKLERRHRSKKINEFQPHITVIIHFNVDAKNDPWTRPSDRNLSMTFVGGSFMKGELEKQEDRYHFLRLLISDDIYYSAQLCGMVMRYYKKELKVPAASITDESYLTNACLKTDFTGVFCRNLYLTRAVQGTVIYGESQYQDHRRESLLLNDAKQQPIRLKKVANAYYKAILRYIRKVEE